MSLKYYLPRIITYLHIIDKSFKLSFMKFFRLIEEKLGEFYCTSPFHITHYKSYKYNKIILQLL